jgi:prolipoprotein diacylglyceryltransferase
VIYLLLSILFNAVLFIIIKLFAKFNIDALQALVVNYFIAFGVGLFFLDTFFSPQIIMSQQLHHNEMDFQWRQLPLKCL